MYIYIHTISGGSDPVGIPSQVWMHWSEKRVIFECGKRRDDPNRRRHWPILGSLTALTVLTQF
jgi:hypothetical protein